MQGSPVLLFVLCLGGAAAFGKVARAEGDVASESEAMIQRGIQLRRQRDDAAALESFRQAYAANPTPRALAQIALAEQALGKWVDAERDLSQSMARDDVWIRNNMPLLQRALDSIEQHLASLSVTTNVVGAEMWIDGVRVIALPAPAVRVVAGSTVIEIRAPAYETVRRAIAIPQGAEWREEVRLVPIQPAAEAAVVSPAGRSDRPPSSPGSTQRAIGLSIGGLGLAGLATGAVFGLLANHAKSDYAKLCGPIIGAPSGSCNADGVRGQADASRKATTATWFFVGGGLAAVAGITLFLTAPRRGPSAQIGVGVAGLSVSGHL